MKNVEERNTDDELQDHITAARSDKSSWWPYTSCVQIENIEQTVLSLEPGDNSIPKYILLD